MAEMVLPVTFVVVRCHRNTFKFDRVSLPSPHNRKKNRRGVETNFVINAGGTCGCTARRSTQLLDPDPWHSVHLCCNSNETFLYQQATFLKQIFIQMHAFPDGTCKWHCFDYRKCTNSIQWCPAYLQWQPCLHMVTNSVWKAFRRQLFRSRCSSIKRRIVE